MGTKKRIELLEHLAGGLNEIRVICERHKISLEQVLRPQNHPWHARAHREVAGYLHFYVGLSHATLGQIFARDRTAITLWLKSYAEDRGFRRTRKTDQEKPYVRGRREEREFIAAWLERQGYVILANEVRQNLHRVGLWAQKQRVQGSGRSPRETGHFEKDASQTSRSEREQKLSPEVCEAITS